jgi:type II secretory pathway pseudopilin PulG
MSTRFNDQRGFALITVMLVVIIVALMATGAAVIGSSHTVANRYYDRESQLDNVALDGISLAMARIQGNPGLYPATGYSTLENGVSVTGADGNPIPGVTRWTYVGPTGSTSGQYGVFGSIVSVARDAGGAVAIRRQQIYQESFAKFAYFTDVEPSDISFGGGDQIFGPVHTNDYLKIYSSGATFFDVTTTAKTVQGARNGIFKKGYKENVARIPMPTTTDLAKLQAQATAGGTAFTAGAPFAQGQAYMRIEFMAIDLNGDGSVTGANEGFFRVYQSSDPAWVSGDPPSGGMVDAMNCGDYHGSTFVPDSLHPYSGGGGGGRGGRGGRGGGGGRTGAPGITDDVTAALSNATKRCYLGGSDSINGGFVANDGRGSWLRYPGTPDTAVTNHRPDDAQYLFPLSRQFNPSFKGVIYVNGNVVISGVVRGHVTVAASGRIIIGDDVTYASDPALGTCADMLGMFAGNEVVVADNELNSPQSPTSGSNYFTYDDTKDEFIQGIVLALNDFTVENYASGSTKAEPCEGALQGRGCLYLTGGIIQETRGAVGTITSPGGTGYVKRYAYDKCGATSPPPYYPTTGVFSKGQLYQVDPVGFDIDSYWAMLTAGG